MKSIGYVVEEANSWQEAFAGAIVATAAKDYKKARKNIKNEKKRAKAARDIREIERFFHSDLFQTLTDLDGEMLINEIKNEGNGRSEKPAKQSISVKDCEACEGCIHYRYYDQGTVKCCCYIFDEDKMRGCPPGELCDKYEAG